jgi:uncharacterized protein
MCVDWRRLIVPPNLTVMSEPTPPGSAPQEPTPPTFEAPPSAPSAPTPPGYSAPPPSAPPGYSAPPSAPGGYGAPAGAPYGAPIGGNVAPVGYADNDEKMWALIAHFGGAAAALVSGGFLGWVPPLVAMLVKGNTSATARAHAVAALNFQALWTVVSVIGYVLLCVLIGLIIIPIAVLMSVIFGIIAGIKANEGNLYKYPATVNIIK